MKKLYTLAFALLASLAFTAPAHAFLIDGFGDTQEEDEALKATAPGPAPGDETVATSGFVNISNTDLDSAQRQLTVTQEGGPDGFAGDSVTAEVSDDVYKYDQSTRTFGTGTIEWTFDARTFSEPLAIALNLLEVNDTGASITFTLDGAAGSFFHTMALPEVDATSPTSIFFNVTGFDPTKTFDKATLFINGKDVSALALTADFISVPAPGVLGMLGIGLAGLAFAVRRRRAANDA